LSPDEEKYVNQLILKIRNESGLDVIANGIRFSLKYYLRFMDDCKEFLQSYSKNLLDDARNSTEVQEIHVITWQEILQRHHWT